LPISRTRWRLILGLPLAAATNVIIDERFCSSLARAPIPHRPQSDVVFVGSRRRDAKNPEGLDGGSGRERLRASLSADSCSKTMEFNSRRRDDRGCECAAGVSRPEPGVLIWLTHNVDGGFSVVNGARPLLARIAARYCRKRRAWTGSDPGRRFTFTYHR